MFQRSVVNRWAACVISVLIWGTSALSAAAESALTANEVTPENIVESSSLDSSVQDILDRAEQALLQYNAWTKKSPLSMVISSDSLPSSISSLQHLRVLEQTYENLVHEINTKQIQKVEAALGAYFTQISNHQLDKASISTNETDISLEQLERIFLSTLSARIKGLIQEAVDDSELQTTLSAQSDREQGLKLSNPKSLGSCLSVEQAAVEVHEALMRYARDGIGHIDRARYIVHQYTSPTYVFMNDATRNTLGNTWWRRYIPQDWEALLPGGWQSWKNIFALPDHIYHTFRLSGATTAPPEAVLDASTLPGHCWAVSMQGSSAPPTVTIGLTEPVAVSAISIDHTSRLLLKHPEEQMKSAPKRLKVYGYAPCDVACHDLGFDVSSKFLLNEILFDIDRVESVQTFPVTELTKSKAASTTADSPDAASCSMVKETCNGDHPTSSIVAAVSVEVIENWGNEDYTCLYRVRIHGEPRR